MSEPFPGVLQKKEFEKKKKHREMVMEMRRTRREGQASRDRDGCGNYTGGSGYVGENWSNDSGIDHEARRKETLELARQRQRERVSESSLEGDRVGCS